MATNARQFTAPNDEIILASLGATLINGFAASTIVAVVKLDDLTNLKVILALGSGGNNATFYVDTNESLGYFNGIVSRHSPASMTASTGVWYLVGMTRASGTTTARFHVYNYSTDAWDHQNAIDGTQANSGVITADDGWIGQDNGSAGAGWNGAIQAMAFWNSALTDPNIETLHPSKAAWTALSPSCLWVMNQSAVSTEPPDEIGAADGTGHTGTSVTTGNPEWDDGSAAAPGPTRTFSPIPFMKRGQ